MLLTLVATYYFPAGAATHLFLSRKKDLYEKEREIDRFADYVR